MPKPVAFMVMPFGKKAVDATGTNSPTEVDFDALRGRVPGDTAAFDNSVVPERDGRKPLDRRLPASAVYGQRRRTSPACSSAASARSITSLESPHVRRKFS